MIWKTIFIFTSLLVFGCSSLVAVLLVQAVEPGMQRSVYGASLSALVACPLPRRNCD